MKAFLVHLNGKRLCLAGIGNHGVLNATVNWAGRNDRGGKLGFIVGGLETPTTEHVRWNTPPIKVGDTITITIVEADVVDKVSARYRSTDRRNDSTKPDKA